MARRFFIWAAILSLFLDQLSKVLAYGLLTEHVPRRILGEFLRLSLTSNSHGLFGISYGPRPVYFILPLVGIALVVFFAIRSSDKWLGAAYGLVLGGALGNLIDRVRLGAVIDFIDMGLPGWRWYTYNVADAAVVVGVLLLIGREFILTRRAKRQAEVSEPPPDTSENQPDAASIP